MRPLLVPLLLCIAMPALADEIRPGEDACEADIHRLCDKFFPDEKLIATCLVDRRADLSPACAELLANPPSAAGEGSPPAAPPNETPGR